MVFRRVCLLVLAACSLNAGADQIVLHDGSSIQGEVMSMQNGQYTLRTESLGVVTVSSNKIQSISSGAGRRDSAKQAGPSSGQTAAMQAIQSRMASDKGIMASVTRLQNDPDMQAVLQDPEVMQAVQNFDLQTLANHPKLKKLMNNSQAKSIAGKVN